MQTDFFSFCRLMIFLFVYRGMETVCIVLLYCVFLLKSEKNRIEKYAYSKAQLVEFVIGSIPHILIQDMYRLYTLQVPLDESINQMNKYKCKIQNIICFLHLHLHSYNLCVTSVSGEC